VAPSCTLIHMHLGLRLAIGLFVILFGAGLFAPVQAARATVTELSLDAAPAYADGATTLRLDLVDAGGAGVPNASVAIERRTAGWWTPVATVTTDQDGHATQPVTLSRSKDDNIFRGSYAGDATYGPTDGQTQVDLKRRASKVVVHGPAKVVDGRSVPIQVRWTALSGQPVAGAVRLFRSLSDGRWRKVETLATGADGRAEVRVTPRQDSRWRAQAVGQDWVAGDRSGVHRVDNLPPGKPVRLPKAAPSPRIKLPRQPHGVGAGAHVVVTRIPDGVWRQMTGRSWHQGCPIGRADLRLVRVNYWDYQGYRRRGELVASTGAAGPMGAAIAEMYQRKLPIRAMYRVDRFGWGKRSHGGNDYKSMAAGNTSAFNCRDVTGRPGVRSPHSYGRSLDVNTWENPYRSAQGIVPNSWWQPHSHPRVAWRSRSHPVVQIMARHGLRWTYGNGDTQHFDYVGGSARAFARPIPCDQYCD
jgi:5-hydroxyisourate hydrolase-like protein (transthyretin family)